MSRYTKQDNMRKGLLCGFLGALALVGAAMGGAYAVWASFPPVPPLIGHGCAGAGGDVFAFEESDFPTTCEVIERNL